MLPLLSRFSSPWFVCRFLTMSNNRLRTVARFPARRRVMLTRRSARRWQGRSAPPSRGRSAARWWRRSLTSQPKRWAELSLDFSYTITFTLYRSATLNMWMWKTVYHFPRIFPRRFQRSSVSPSMPWSVRGRVHTDNWWEVSDMYLLHKPTVIHSYFYALMLKLWFLKITI